MHEIMKSNNHKLRRIINIFLPTLSWPSGKGVAAVTSATWIQLTVGGTIYNAWVPGKEVKIPFFLPKKKI